MEPAAPVTPFVVAMLLCEQVITDEESKKKTLVGIFDQVAYPGEPYVFPITIYVRLTDAAGTYRVAIEYAHTATDRLIGRVEVPTAMEIPDRLKFHDLVIRMPVPIDDLGEFELRLYANDAYLGRTRFRSVPQSPAEEA